MKELLRVYTEDHRVANAEGQVVHMHTWCNDLGKLTYKGKHYAKVPISQIMGISYSLIIDSAYQLKIHFYPPFCTNTDFSELNPFCTVSQFSSLPTLLAIFKQGIHRAVVIDDSQDLCRIVSQTNVVRFLADHLHLCGKIGQVRKMRVELVFFTQSCVNYFMALSQATLEELGLVARSPVVSVNIHIRALNAFVQMQTNKVSAVAITDDCGILAANISIRYSCSIGKPIKQPLISLSLSLSLLMLLVAAPEVI